MQPRFRKIAVFVGSAALAGGVAVGVAAKGDDTTQAATTQQQQPGGRPGDRMDLSALADALGVTSDQLEAAMQSGRSSASGPDALAATLAQELGLSEAKVAAALEANRPDGGQGLPPGSGAPPAGATPPDGTTTS